MKKLNIHDFQEVKLWIYRNARNIELSLWKYYFENGSKEDVISSLLLYQNEDGGFGHALEADNWNPNSSPYITLVAINILKSINFHDKNHEIMQGIFKFLESNSYFTEDGWYFNIPSNNDYAHAPWWTYNMEVNAVESIGVTAGLTAFIIRNADENSDIYKRALNLCDKLIIKFMTSLNYGDMGVGEYCTLLSSIEETKLTERYEISFFTKKLKKAVHDSIERDMSKWIYYSVRPSQYISSPESRFYKDNEDIVSSELDYIIEIRQKNGVWDITWSWLQNNDKYAKEFAISENWWKSYKAIENMNFLKNFNRLEGYDHKDYFC